MFSLPRSVTLAVLLIFGCSGADEAADGAPERNTPLASPAVVLRAEPGVPITDSTTISADDEPFNPNGTAVEPQVDMPSDEVPDVEPLICETLADCGDAHPEADACRGFGSEAKHCQCREVTCEEAKRGLIWVGNPNKGTDIFDNLNFEEGSTSSASGTIKPALDPTFGDIWRVHKPAPDKRAEIRGATGFSDHHGEGGVMEEGGIYYVGWRLKYAMPDKQTGGFATFQWKSYPGPGQPITQNYPFIIDYNGRELTLTKFDPDWQSDRDRRIVKLWRGPLRIGEWASIVLGIKVSRNGSEGFIEFYYNGEIQELMTGGTRVSHRTMDGMEVAPKWGAYNRFAIGTEITVDLADMRIGTELQSVLPTP